MAGSKETPRQRMIGMMYLVLTALLALNVSKEIISAFVTINDRLESSAEIINNKSRDNYTTFELKRMSLVAKGSDMTVFNTWNNKAIHLSKETNKLVGYILSECNDMIAKSEGEDWVAVDGIDLDGNITHLKPLMQIKVKDNYDIPTELFVGSNPNSPNERGLALLNSIHTFRNLVCEQMGTYSEGKSNWVFNPPNQFNGLKHALTTCNPKDTAKIGHFYRSLTIPDKLYDYSEEKEMPWSYVTFNHAPIVAAAAIFTSLKVDIKNAEAIASEYMLNKIQEPPYYINKIEPMAFARSSYINQGDSLNLKVLIAAYDSNEVNLIRWGMDADTLVERWNEGTGNISLSGASPGAHRVKGAIGVKESGNIVWKNWEFDYAVGQPLGVISLPEMRVLYRGYKNVVDAAASGFSNDQISLNGTGCKVERLNGKWYVTPNSGVRNASLSVIAKKDDGSSLNVGTYQFVVRKLPDPEVSLGSISNGEEVSRSTAISNTRVIAVMGSEVNLTGVNYSILSGELSVEGLMKKGKILANGHLDEDAKKALRQASGKNVSVFVKYKDPSNEVRTGGLVFKVR